MAPDRRSNENQTKPGKRPSPNPSDTRGFRCPGNPWPMAAAPITNLGSHSPPDRPRRSCGIIAKRQLSEGWGGDAVEGGRENACGARRGEDPERAGTPRARLRRRRLARLNFLPIGKIGLRP
ncbi:hypothetical protein GWI33_002621 [Rhynchophorus ferrugineus]|uniref:Uncharacterized protein n=1 Tax=Rhynchophorus ferrugineus TaxID=354439 RepID=A0A834MFL1_RHYFE|nr:hypothetical protein GWI33_002621 [Rhynchophorus ferrugineus]